MNKEQTIDEVNATVKAELAKISDKAKEYGERAFAEAKKTGDMTAELKPKVDELLVSRGELQAQLLDLQQKQDQRGKDEGATPQTLGDHVIRDEGYKKWLQDGGMKSAQSGYVLKINAALTSIATTNTTTVGVNPDMQPGVIPGTSRRLTIRDLIAPGQTSSDLIHYVRETGFTNAAATVSEGDVKPESTLTYENKQAPVVTIAHWIKASKQILADFKQLQSMIDARLRYGLKLVEENQLLKGSGTGENLNGIYTQATAYSAPIVVTQPTKIDELRLMLLQAELAEYPATGIVLNPADWAAIELTKDSQRAYLFANPQSLATPRLWGLPVVATQAMTVDTALVGSFAFGAQLFDREEMNVVISSEDQDNFVRNMISIRCEERIALAVTRPAAFIKNANLSAS